MTSRRTTGDSSRLSPACAVSAAARLPEQAAAGAAVPAQQVPAAGGGGGAALVPVREPVPARAQAPVGSGAGSASRRGRCRRSAVGVTDDGDHGADVDGVAFLHPDLGEHAGHRRRHLGVDLVGRHLEQRLVVGDGVTDVLEPLRDGALGDRFTELWERDVCHGRSLFFSCRNRVVFEWCRLSGVSSR